MIEAIIVGLVVLAALVIYLIASHKIGTAAQQARFDGIAAQLHLVHAAAMAPVLVAPAPTAAPAPLAQPALRPGDPGFRYGDARDMAGATSESMAAQARNAPKPGEEAANAAASDAIHNSASWEFGVDGSPRIFRTTGPGVVSKSFTVPADFTKGAVQLDTGDTTGNVVNVADFVVTDDAGVRVAEWLNCNVRYQHLTVPVSPGKTYTVTVSTADPLSKPLGGYDSMAISIVMRTNNPAAQ